MRSFLANITPVCTKYHIDMSIAYSEIQYLI